MIELHYVPTPNGQKVAILLTELGLQYRLKTYDIFAGDHLAPAFGTINPNHKLPAIVDLAPEDGAAPLRVFESGSILLYLADRHGRFVPAAARPRAETVNWLFWQMAGLGPMSGQAHHFCRYAPLGQAYAVERYVKEVRRLLAVLDRRLGEAEYLGGEYSIADMACSPWLRNLSMLGIEEDEFPRMAAWRARIALRPAVKAVYDDPRLATADQYRQERAELSESQWSNLFGEDMWRAARQ